MLKKRSKDPRSYLLNLIKIRPRSESELRQRLAAQSLDPTAIDDLINDFKAKDLVGDPKFSLCFVQDQMAFHPVSRGLLLEKLKARGVDAGIAQQAVDQAVEEPEMALGLRLAKDRLKQLKNLEPMAIRRRLYGFLERRGFSQELVEQVVREVLGELDEGI